MSEPLLTAMPRNVAVAETEFVITWSGCQPIFVAMTYAWIVGVGVTKITSVVAPDAFSLTSWAAGFGAVTSNGSASTMSGACA